MPDRDSISDAAKSVWNSFFNKNLNISKEAPIDQHDKPITLSNPLDDGRIYIKDKINRNNFYEYQKIKNMNPIEQEKYLKNMDTP